MSIDALGRVNGPTILLASGCYFDVEQPAAPAPDIISIIWGLATQRRFAGQTRLGGRHCMYTVAQHCVMPLEEIAGPDLKYAFLMHELGEFVWGDLPGPLKGLVPDYKRWEKQTQHQLAIQFGVRSDLDKAVKQIDLRMAVTERRDLMVWDGAPWNYFGEFGPADPYKWHIDRCWSPEEAADKFYLAYQAWRRN